jgi:Ca-activated chloride channel homolog
LIAVSVLGALLTVSGAPPQAQPQKPPQAQPQTPPQAQQQTPPQAQQQKPPQTQQQTPPAQPPPETRIVVSTTEVVLPITVTDDKGRFVSNLEQKDFRILDEGRVQRITFFSHETRQPTVIGFLVDQSSNSTIHWATYKDAIKEMIWGLLPNDKNFTGYLISYNSSAELAVNTTWDPDKLTDKVDRMKPGGGAALFNAVRRACVDRELVPGEPFVPRRVIVVVGDGHDNASDYTIDQAIELALRNQVTIYGVSTAAYGMDNPDRDQLERLATQTGGRVWYPLDNPYKDVSGFLSQPSDEGNYALKVGTGGYAAAISSAIMKAVGDLQGEITTQYVVRYRPDLASASSLKDKHRIQVKVLPVGNFTVLTRPFYYPDALPGAGK